MPAEKANSKILAKLKARGADKVLKKHANDELKFDTGGLLPPFENGIAQVTKLYFGEYEKGDNKGQPYFMGMAVIKEGMSGKLNLRGKQTKIGPIALCDEPKANKGKGRSFEENFAKVQAALRKLGAESVETLDEVAASMESIVEEGPHFACRAWKGQPTKEYPDPRINEVWDKVVDDYVDDTSDAVSSDDTAKDEVAELTDEEPEAEEEAAEETTEESGLDADEINKLAELADTEVTPKNKAKVIAAQKTLSGHAKEAGFDANEIDTWGEVAEKLLGDVAEEGAAEEEEAVEEEVEEEWAPEKGHVYKLKNGKSTIDFQVSAINEAKKTVDGKNTATKGVLKGIAWDKLIHD